MQFIQKRLRLPAVSEGFHLITDLLNLPRTTATPSLGAYESKPK